jgi:hypothetical protein
MAADGGAAVLALRVAAVVAGVLVVAGTLGSAVRTVVVPRAIASRLSRAVFVGVRRLFRLRAGPNRSYEARDRVMALYAPVGLFVLLLTWYVLVIAGFTGIFWGLGEGSLRESLVLSGSSITTLGFARPGDLVASVLAFSEAAFGLVLLALLITYLPSIYGVFSRREALVASLEVRAGSPATAVELLQRSWRVERLDGLRELWSRWEDWFLDVSETHTSIPALVFFRSPLPDHSWVISSGAVLDSASLLLSCVDRPFDPRAAFCIRAGYLALRRVATFFHIPFNEDPQPDDPISILREEFDQAYDALGRQGLPLKEDRDQAWRDFKGWRVNYDRVVIALAGLTMAPPAPWISDRSLRDWRPRAVFGREGPRRR